MINADGGSLDAKPIVRECQAARDGLESDERKIGSFIQDKMEQWCGTRMGDAPETNVVDRWGFSHEAPNLGVLGASVMGTSGARNPTLTAQALAWRTAEHLAKRFNAIARKRT